MSQPRSIRRSQRSSSSRPLRVETLEQRQLLSASGSGFATTYHRAASAGGAVAPLASSGPSGYSPAQIRHAYGFDQVGYDGTGTTIAIVDAYDDPNIANDLHAFDVQFGLADPVFTKVNQYGSTTSLPAADKGWASEIALDVEWAHAIAPGATILLVEANSNSFSDLLTAVDYARNAPGVVAVSMSWGGGEFSGEQSYDSHFVTPAGHQGVSFFVSSGDSGAPTSYPATSPNVVSVGGTSLYLSGGSYGSESGWSGSGGGTSSYESRPAYQAGVTSSAKRSNPDVAYDSDPSTGFPVYDSYNNGTARPWSQFGGTSAAAPQWAALTALADQGRAQNGLSSLNTTQLLTTLYSLPASDFHDVVTGSSTGSPKLSAGPGYDQVTGLGTPVANLLIPALAGQPAKPTATSFSVSGTTTATAGTSFTLTVTALDQSNKTFAGYTGTVHFSANTVLAVGASLPADYQFTAADQGVHTFTFTLVTAGSTTITARDTTSTSIVGSTGVNVSAGAAAGVAFVTQPSTATVNTSLAPTVSVRVVDAFGNTVTSDNTDQVTLSLTGGTTGAALVGTTTVTVAAGVASFTGLSVNQVGTGYSLVATFNTFTATSNAFSVLAVGAGGVVESFSSTSLSNYTVVGARRASANISTSSSASHDGVGGLADTNGNDWIYRNDTAATVKAGDTISVWLKFSGSPNGRAYFGFGTSATGTYALTAAPNSGQLLLQQIDFTTNTSGGGNFTQLAAVNQTYQAGVWYKLQVVWGANGQIVGQLYAADGVTLVNSVQATSTSITSGGFGFRAIGIGTKYWDTVTLTPGVNTTSNSTGASGTGATSGSGSGTTGTGSGTGSTGAGSGGFSGWAGWSGWGGWWGGFTPWSTSSVSTVVSTTASSSSLSIQLTGGVKTPATSVLQSLFAHW